jgi:hypothetical protein
LEVAALPENVLMLEEDPGTKALAEVDTVAAIAKSATVFFMVNIMIFYLSCRRIVSAAIKNYLRIGRDRRRGRSECQTTRISRVEREREENIVTTVTGVVILYSATNTVGCMFVV